MDLSFIDVELARACNDDALRERQYGHTLAAVLRRRLAEVDAAAHLADLSRLPAVRLRAHPEDSRVLLIALGSATDLHLRPRVDPLPQNPDGTLRYADVRAVVVIGIQPAPAANTRPALLRARREAS